MKQCKKSAKHDKISMLTKFEKDMTMFSGGAISKPIYAITTTLIVLTILLE